MDNDWKNLDKDSIDYVEEITNKNNKFKFLIKKLKKAKELIHIDSEIVKNLTQEIK